jgi:hypothetical protein
MSAGAYIESRYESNELGLVPLRIRIQPETQGLFVNGTANGPSGSTIPALPLFARSSGSRNAYGVHARSVALEWVENPPPGYLVGGTVRVPIMTVPMYQACTPGSLGQYLGAAVRVVSRRPEVVN